MERVVLVFVLAALAVVVAVVAQRRRRPPSPVVTGHVLPDRLDRADFDRPEAPWLVAVFTSATCKACAGVWDKAALLASDEVAVQQLEAKEQRDIHTRYRVTAVPAVLVTDAGGTVRARFLGPVTATDLWATVADLRAPGSLPDASCDHGVAPPTTP
jgi:hypothetical protein